MNELLRISEAGFQTVAVPPTLRQAALHHLGRWLREAEFAPYRPQIEWLIRQGKWAELLDRFYQVLPFGTGGRRGPVGIGPNRMNPWTLAVAVQGHCQYLKERFPEAVPLSVVLAYDVRRFEDVRQQYNPALPNPLLGLTSRDLARHAATVYAANGIIALMLPPDSPRYMATPELSHAIRYYRSHGGLNISASHNPPDDSGGKFYDESGGQAVPPDDQIMADLVERVSAVRTMSWHDAVRCAKVRFLDDAAHEDYLELNARQSLLGPARVHELTLVYTPLHGVGSFTVMKLLQRQRFRVLPVSEQMVPDGRFPDCTSPNPEVPASMDRAVAVAQAWPAAELVLSTDPDADRLGAMARRRDGTWQYLTGNHIAALITHFKLLQLSRQGLMPASPLVITTEVTTRLVSRIARAFGCQVIDDLLVGFKYIGEVLRKLETEGQYGEVVGRPEDFIIGCEESHGVLVTPHVRDKDACGGALLLAELALYQKRRGFTVPEYLEQLHRDYGYYHNSLHYLAMTGVLGREQMLAMLRSLRQRPPREVAGLPVTHFADHQREDGRWGPFKGETDRAARNMLVFQLGGKARIVLRPSGTEPKAKAYVEVHTDAAPLAQTAEEWQQRCAAADALGQRLGDEFVRLALGRAADL